MTRGGFLLRRRRLAHHVQPVDLIDAVDADDAGAADAHQGDILGDRKEISARRQDVVDAAQFGDFAIGFLNNVLDIFAPQPRPPQPCAQVGLVRQYLRSYPADNMVWRRVHETLLKH